MRNILKPQYLYIEVFQGLNVQKEMGLLRIKGEMAKGLYLSIQAVLLVFLPFPPRLHQRVPASRRGRSAEYVQLLHLAAVAFKKAVFDAFSPLILVVSQPSPKPLLIGRNLPLANFRGHPAVDASLPDTEIFGSLLIPFRIQSLKYLKIHLLPGIVFKHTNSKVLLCAPLRSLSQYIAPQKLNGLCLPVAAEVLPYSGFYLVDGKFAGGQRFAFVVGSGELAAFEGFADGGVHAFEEGDFVDVQVFGAAAEVKLRLLHARLAFLVRPEHQQIQSTFASMCNKFGIYQSRGTTAEKSINYSGKGYSIKKRYNGSDIIRMKILKGYSVKIQILRDRQSKQHKLCQKVLIMLKSTKYAKKGLNMLKQHQIYQSSMNKNMNGQTRLQKQSVSDPKASNITVQMAETTILFL